MEINQVPPASISSLYPGAPSYADASGVRTDLSLLTAAEIAATYSPLAHTHALTAAEITGILPNDKGGPYTGSTNVIPRKTAGGLWVASGITDDGTNVDVSRTVFRLTANNSYSFYLINGANQMRASVTTGGNYVVDATTSHEWRINNSGKAFLSSTGWSFGHIAAATAPIDARATTGNIAWFGYDAANGLGFFCSLAGLGGVKPSGSTYQILPNGGSDTGIQFRRSASNVMYLEPLNNLVVESANANGSIKLRGATVGSALEVGKNGIAFFGGSPVGVQGAAIANPTDAATTQAAVISLLTLHRNLSLIAT